MVQGVAAAVNFTTCSYTLGVLNTSCADFSDDVGYAHRVGAGLLALIAGQIRRTDGENGTVIATAVNAQDKRGGKERC